MSNFTERILKLINFDLKTQQISWIFTFSKSFFNFSLRFSSSSRYLKFFFTFTMLILFNIIFMNLSKCLKWLLWIIFFKFTHRMNIVSHFLKILLLLIQRRLFLGYITLRTYWSIIFTFVLSSLHITLTKLQLNHITLPPTLHATQNKLLTAQRFSKELPRSYQTTLSITIDSQQGDKTLGY